MNTFKMALLTFLILAGSLVLGALVAEAIKSLTLWMIAF